MGKPVKLPSGNWRVQISVDGKRKSFTADTKSEAEFLAASYKRNHKEEQHASKTVREIVEDYIKISEVLSPTTLSAYRKILDHAFPGLMDLPIDALSDAVVQNSINLEAKRPSERSGKSISAKTVKNEWGLLASALRTMAGRSFYVRLPKVQRKNSELPDPEAIIKAVKGTPVELPCLLAMWCGLRLSEIRGLTVDSLKGNVLSIDNVVVDVNNEPVLKSLAKTDTSIRKVRVPNYIIDLVKAQGEPKNGFLVPLTRSYIYYHFTQAVNAAGITMSFHDLRHVFASVMLTKLQCPERVVQDAGGWATDMVMKRVYSGVFSDSRNAADDLRDDYFESLL